MNYFALAGGILAALIALHASLRIAVVASGKQRWHDGWGFPLNAIFAAGFGSLAAWLFSVAL